MIGRLASKRLSRILATCVLAALVVATIAVAWQRDDGGDGGAAATSGPVPEITVAAASDLRPAFEALGGTFTEATGTEVRFSFGSSGQLREQVLNGAPFDVFASANSAYVDEVVEAGVGLADTRTDYAVGRLALWAAPGSALPADLAALAEPRYRRIAIANPEHAPYGLAARQALDAAGVGDAVADRLVYGENVSDALRIAASGNAEVGIIALSLAVASGEAHQPVPAELHEPLDQALVVLGTGARAEAGRAFADHVSGPEGRAVMERYGFALPGDPVPGG